MLHIAPEPFLSVRFREMPQLHYTSADLRSAAAMVQMDITRIPFADDSFAIIFCSHVLEHVDNDRKAISELRRVVSPAGWAVIMVPITAPTTFEDASVADPKMREVLFGQRDHVRQYGPDIEERLRGEGFRVKCFGWDSLARGREAAEMSLLGGDKVFYCTK